MKTYKRIKYTDQITNKEIEYIEVTETTTKVTKVLISELTIKKIEIEDMLKVKLEATE